MAAAMRDYSVQEIGTKTVSCDNSGWTSFALSSIGAGTVTAGTPGRDVAFIEIINEDDADKVYFLGYTPGGNLDVADYGFPVAATGSYRLEKVENITHLAFKCSGAAATIRVVLHSYRNATDAPWT
ncbi:MAG: hypothetical protein VX160_07670 [Actinomycetota bacterium]|nr:hypothetical protein [Actinomycetota bacterium]